MTARTPPLDRRSLTGHRTEQLEAIDRPLAEAGSPSGPLAPGRYLLVEEGGGDDVIVLGRALLVYRERTV